MHMIEQCIKNTIGYFLSKHCIDNPIFIVGSGRSGTSVLLQALGKHDKIIAFPGEAPFLTTIGGSGSLLSSENQQYYLSSLKISVNYFYNSLAKFGIESSGGENYALKEFAKSILRTKKITLKKHWCAKTFPPESVAHGLAKVYPNAKFIYIVRNGIEVVHSMTKFHGFKQNDFSKQCHIWSDSVEKYHYLHQWPNALCLRHEQLVHDPKTFFNGIFDFLDLQLNPDCIDFVSTNLIHPLDEPDQKQQDAITQLKQRQSPFSNWPEEQKKIFESICSNSMQLMNYPIE
ncbi:sulfotransferase [Methylomonas sp. LL1]|uniref:sulfotransferase family protein n=1 Tax=Methylomonas sp. LL1 TaxID=2785785 RepID=UPI0018C40CF9|nr:sulfotransferase [Methylomonas sp. LL1]QPK65320.1 sulfotransferase [Methylomonas sp. LL1]CAG1022309.1 hypothetical protein MTYM_01621 [Methylococcales bacterium]